MEQGPRAPQPQAGASVTPVPEPGVGASGGEESVRGPSPDGRFQSSAWASGSASCTGREPPAGSGLGGDRTPPAPTAAGCADLSLQPRPPCSCTRHTGPLSGATHAAPGSRGPAPGIGFSPPKWALGELGTPRMMKRGPCPSLTPARSARRPHWPPPPGPAGFQPPLPGGPPDLPDMPPHRAPPGPASGTQLCVSLGRDGLPELARSPGTRGDCSPGEGPRCASHRSRVPVYSSRSPPRGPGSCQLVLIPDPRIYPHLSLQRRDRLGHRCPSAPCPAQPCALRPADSVCGWCPLSQLQAGSTSAPQPRTAWVLPGVTPPPRPAWAPASIPWGRCRPAV